MALNPAPQVLRHARWVALALLLAAAWLVARGVWELGMPAPRPQEPLAVWGAVAVVVLALVLAAGLRPVVVACGLGALFAVASGQATALFVVVLFVAACVVVGSWLLRKLGAMRDAEGFLLAFFTGAGAYGTVCGLAAHAPVNYAGVYGPALLLPLLLDRRRCIGWCHSARDYLKGGGVRPAMGQRLVEAAIVVAAFIHFAVAFLPELGFDALATHLFIPDRMRSAHRWSFDVGTYVWAVMPTLVDWIYTITDMLGGESAARLVNVAFIFALAGLLHRLVLWAGGSGAGSRWAVLLFLVMPLTFTESNALFIEAGWSAFMVAGTWAVLRVLDGDPDADGLMGAAGALLGFAMASKAITFALLPALALVMLARPSTWLGRARVRSLGTAVLLGAVVGGVPYLTAWVMTANPVFPFFNALFKSPWFPPENFEPPPFERHVAWNTLYRITFESGRYLEARAGASGFQWLLLLVPCALAAVTARHSRWRSVALLVIGIGGVAAVFQQTAYLRYVFPCAVVLMAVIGVGLTHLMARDWQGAPWTLAAVGAVALNVIYFHSGAAYLDLPLQAAFSDRGRVELIADRKPERVFVPAINAMNTPVSPVMWIAQAGAAGLEAEALYAQWYNHRFAAEFHVARTEAQMLQLIGRRGVEFVVLDSQVQSDAAAALVKVTDEVTSRGGVSLRRVKPALRYVKELAASPDFQDSSAWSLVTGATLDAAGLVLKADTGAFQKIAVVPGRKYLNTVSARCDGPGTLGRLQVNWVTAEDAIIATSGKVYGCGPDWSVHQQEITAPEGAAYGMLYAWGQAGGPLRVRLNSLKGAP